MTSTSDDYIFYRQIKILIGFWCFSISKQKKMRKILIIWGRVLLSIFFPFFTLYSSLNLKILFFNIFHSKNLLFIIFLSYETKKNIKNNSFFGT